MLFEQKKVFIVAEVAQAHDGSLGTAHSFIDAAAECGANAIKFQTHIAAAESTKDEPWRVPFSYQDVSRYEYWKRMEFCKEQWATLRRHAHDRHLKFGSSPFSLQACTLLKEVGIDFWKIASGEVLDLPVVRAIADCNEPVIISNGLSTMDELAQTVHAVSRAPREVALLHCTTAYPTPPEKIGLNMLTILKERFRCPVGLSDHSGKVFASLAAVALGASVLEVHLTHSRFAFGPDVPASLTIEEFRTLVSGVRFLEAALANPMLPRQTEDEIAALRVVFGKGIVPSRPLVAGITLKAEDLICKKPLRGIPAAKLNDVIGRKVKRSISVDEPIYWEDLEEQRT